MVEFLDVLIAVERRSADTSTVDRHHAFSISPTNLPTSGAQNNDVLGAYLRVATDKPPETPPSTVDPGEKISRELAASRQSQQRLKALRREVAWLLHPDRRPGDRAAAAALLARFNAEIDAAIAALSARE